MAAARFRLGRDPLIALASGTKPADPGAKAGTRPAQSSQRTAHAAGQDGTEGASARIGVGVKSYVGAAGAERTTEEPVELELVCLDDVAHVGRRDVDRGRALAYEALQKLGLAAHQVGVAAAGADVLCEAPVAQRDRADREVRSDWEVLAGPLDAPGSVRGKRVGGERVRDEPLGCTRGVPRRDRSAKNRRMGPATCRIDERSQPAGPGLDVVIGEDEELSARGTERQVQRTVLSGNGLDERPQRKSASRGREHGRGFVPAPVVDDERFPLETLDVERREAVEGGSKPTRAVARGEENRRVYGDSFGGRGRAGLRDG